jgi:hypothetical protein
MYIFFLFFLLSIPHGWLPNSVFLFGTGSFFCSTTSCRPCHPAFLPGLHRLSECACFSCVCVTTCTRKQTDSREIGEIVPAHTRVLAHVEITRTPRGGDESDTELVA